MASDVDINMKWIVGTGMTLSIFVVTTILGFQSGVDSRQDARIKDVDAQYEAVTKRQEQLFEKLSENDRRTAEALKDVAATLREIDRRGTQVFREHERMTAEEGH